MGPWADFSSFDSVRGFCWACDRGGPDLGIETGLGVTSGAGARVGVAVGQLGGPTGLPRGGGIDARLSPPPPPGCRAGSIRLALSGRGGAILSGLRSPWKMFNPPGMLIPVGVALEMSIFMGELADDPGPHTAPIPPPPDKAVCGAGDLAEDWPGRGR